MSKKLSDQDVKSIAQYISRMYAITSGRTSAKGAGKTVSDQDKKQQAYGGKIKKKARGGKVKKRK